jgi:hypothetical protein
MGDVSHSDTGAAAAETRPAAALRARRPSREALLDAAPLGAVLLVYAIVQLEVLQGPKPLDPSNYFNIAVNFPDVPLNPWTLRIGLIAPVRAAVLVFGPSEAAFYAVPVATGLVLAAAVYGTMLLLFRDRVAAAAAALVTVLNTVYLLNSSAIYPDTTATATFTAGFFFLVLSGMRPHSRAKGWVSTAAVVCAGILFGWTYLIREFSPLLLPAVLAALLLWVRYAGRRIVILVGAAVATFCLELLYGFVRYRDPFAHLELLLNRGDIPISAARLQRMERIQGQLDVIDTIIVFPRLVLSWQSGPILLALLVLFVVALALFRDRRLWVLAAWCVSFWAIMAVLGLAALGSERWILNITNVRYWYPILPALVMGAFGGLHLLVNKFLPSFGGLRPTQAVAPLVAGLVLVPGLVEYRNCAAADAWRNDPAERWHDLRSWAATPEAERYTVLWTDVRSARLVPAFIRKTFGERLWHGVVKTFPHPRRGIIPETDVQHSLILVHWDAFRAKIPQAKARLSEVRREWSPVFISRDGGMVLLAHESAATGEAVDAVRAWWRFPGRPRSAKPGHCGRSPYEVGGQE